MRDLNGFVTNKEAVERGPNESIVGDSVKELLMKTMVVEDAINMLRHRE